MTSIFEGQPLQNTGRTSKSKQGALWRLEKGTSPFQTAGKKWQALDPDHNLKLHHNPQKEEKSHNICVETTPFSFYKYSITPFSQKTAQLHWIWMHFLFQMSFLTEKIIFNQSPKCTYLTLQGMNSTLLHPGILGASRWVGKIQLRGVSWKLNLLETNKSIFCWPIRRGRLFGNNMEQWTQWRPNKKLFEKILENTTMFFLPCRQVLSKSRAIYLYLPY